MTIKANTPNEYRPGTGAEATSNLADDYEQRLAEELRKVGVLPGRNPDGVNDDPEKAGLVMREALSDRDRARSWVFRLIGAIDDLALYEPGRKGYAAALRRLEAERDWAWRELNGSAPTSKEQGS